MGWGGSSPGHTGTTRQGVVGHLTLRVCSEDRPQTQVVESSGEVGVEEQRDCSECLRDCDSGPTDMGRVFVAEPEGEVRGASGDGPVGE